MLAVISAAPTTHNFRDFVLICYQQTHLVGCKYILSFVFFSACDYRVFFLKDISGRLFLCLITTASSFLLLPERFLMKFNWKNATVSMNPVNRMANYVINPTNESGNDSEEDGFDHHPLGDRSIPIKDLIDYSDSNLTPELYSTTNENTLLLKYETTPRIITDPHYDLKDQITEDIFLIHYKKPQIPRHLNFGFIITNGETLKKEFQKLVEDFSRQYYVRTAFFVFLQQAFIFCLFFR